MGTQGHEAEVWEGEASALRQAQAAAPRDPRELYSELLDELDQERPIDPEVKKKSLDEFEDSIEYFRSLVLDE